MELGITVEDQITGFKGILVGKKESLGERDIYEVQPKMDGTTYIESKWFNEGRLKEIKTDKICIVGFSIGDNKNQ